MSEPRQYRRDPATGGFCEDRLAASPLPLEVCPNPKCAGGGYYVGPECSACSTDDDSDPDDTDFAPTQPEPPELPPVNEIGGSD